MNNIYKTGGKIFTAIKNHLQTPASGWFSLIGTISIINATLAIVSFLKDIIFASYMGTSSYSDAFMLAFFIPDTIGNNIFGYTVCLTSIPIFAELLAKKQFKSLSKTINTVIVISISFIGLLLVLIYLFSDHIVGFIDSGFSADSLKLSVSLLYILLPTMLFFTLQVILGGILTVFEKFNVPAFAPVIFNIVYAISLIFCITFGIAPIKGVYIVSASISLAVLASCAFVYLSFRKSTKALAKYKKEESIIEEDTILVSQNLKSIFHMFVPFTLIILCTQIIYTVERNIATGLTVGAVSCLNYAFRLSQFPLWVFVTAISTVILPSMSKSKGMENHTEMRATLAKALRLIIIILLPLTLAINILRIPIVNVLFVRGAFNAVSENMTSSILAGLSLAIIFQGMSTVILRAFLVVRKMKVPLIAFSISAVVNIAADIILTRKIGVSGLGYGALIGAITNSILMISCIIREFELELLHIWKKMMRIIAANIPLLITLVTLSKLWRIIMGGNTVIKLAYCVICLGVSVIVYLSSLRLCKIA